MTKKQGKRYTPKFKFQVVMETLRSERTDAEVARTYQVHPITLCKWKKALLEKGPEVFSGQESVQEYERKIAQLERMVGRKEVEIAL